MQRIAEVYITDYAPPHGFSRRGWESPTRASEWLKHCKRNLETPRIPRDVPLAAAARRVRSGK